MPRSQGDHEIDSRQLFGALQELQKLGVGKQIHLPQLVSFGDQSAGKSSVLRALFSIPFPTDSGLSTRHPTRLTMERATDENQTGVTILANIERHDGQVGEYAHFPQTTTFPGDVPRIMEEAAADMKINKSLGPGGKRFSKDVLSLRLVSRKFQYNLTVVDLPGLFLMGDGEKQTEEDVTFVNDLVKEYINQPNTVVLAVVSALQETVNQSSLHSLRKLALKDIEVLLIVTKPDKLDHDDGAKSSLVRQVITNPTSFGHGWHVLRNFPPATVDAGLDMKLERENRIRGETEFFAQSSWEELPVDKRGLQSLESRLLTIQTKLHNDSFLEVYRAATALVRDLDQQISQISTTPMLSEDAQDFLYELSANLISRLKEPRLEIDGPLAFNTNLTAAITNFKLSMTTARQKTFDCGMQVYDLEEEMSKDIQASLKQYIRKYAIQKNDPPGRVGPEVVLKMFESQSSDWVREVDSLISTVVNLIELHVQALFELQKGYDVFWPGFKRVVLEPSLMLFKKAMRPSKSLRLDSGDLDDSLAHELLAGSAQGLARSIGRIVQDQFVRQKTSPGTNTAHHDGYDVMPFRKAVEQVVEDDIEELGYAQALTNLCSFYQVPARSQTYCVPERH